MYSGHHKIHYPFLILLVCLAFAACKSVKLKDAEKAHDRQEYTKAADMYNTLYRRTRRKHIRLSDPVKTIVPPADKPKLCVAI